MRLPPVLAALVAFATAAPAYACEEVAVSPFVAARAKTASDAGWALKETFELSATAAGTQSASANAALFGQLADPSCEVTTLVQDGARVEVTQPTGPAAELAGILAMDGKQATTQVPTWWDGGEDGLRKLALFYASSDPARRVGQVVVVRALRPAWNSSTIANNYGPFREVLKTRYDLALGVEDKAVRNLILTMMRENAEQFDSVIASGSVPKDAFNFIKPES